MSLFWVLILVGIAFLAVGYFLLKSWDVQNERIGVRFTIIGFICFGIGILGNLAIPFIEMMRDAAS